MAEPPIFEGSDPWPAETPTGSEPRPPRVPAGEGDAPENGYGYPHPEDGEREPGPGGRHYSLLELDRVVGGLKTLAGVNLWGLSGAEILEFFDGVERARRLVAGVLFA